MTITEILAIFAAGLGAGAINTLVGSGTLITFPTLVAFGYAPVTATISNAIGLVAGGVSGTWGYRRELSGQWRQLKWQMPASFLGALVGCYLLLHLPESVFEAVVPILMVAALVLVVAQPRIQRWVARRTGFDVRAVADERTDHHRLPMTPVRVAAMITATFLIGIYGGYFTAAQGIMLIAALGIIVPDDKNLLSLIVNIVAAVTYTITAFDRISWAAAGLIAAGSLIGGVLGARYGRRLSPTALRATIVVVGIIGLVRLVFA